MLLSFVIKKDMPLLKFEVEADYDKVIKLREEITRLNDMLLNLPGDAPVATVRNIEAELARARTEFTSITRAAAQAGAELEDGFKKKIYDASQTVNDFTERIIEQKEKVRSTSTELRRIGDAIKGIAKDATGEDWFKKQHLTKQYNELKQSLEQEKDALFNLTQEQATARLSVKRLRDEYALLKEEAGDNSEMFEEMKEQFMGMGKNILGTIGLGLGVKEFVGQMMQVRGEFQQIETSLEVLLGSEEKAAKLMGEVKEFAKVSPLDLKSTAAATQMMLGFNIEAEKVPRYLQAIGDISMGDAQRFNSLTLAFSQMSATGKLMGQDLNQMINAGFNPLQAMADKTGKSMVTLKEEMSKGAISAAMVQQAFIDATDAGGKFYQMSEKASKTINGQLSMLQDALDAMFNSLGEQSEGVMLSAIETTTSLIENYETVGKVVAGLVAVYGTYKTAVILNIALTRSWAVAARADATAKGIQTIATKAATLAQHGLNAAMRANPYGLAAAALIAVGAAVYAYATRTSEAEEAQKRLNDAISKAQGEIDGEQANIEILFNALKKAKEGTKEYEQAKASIISQYGDYLQVLINEKNQLLDVEAAYLRVTRAAEESARARALESVTQDAGNTFAEKTGEAQKNIWETIEKNVKNKNLKDTLIRLVKNDIGNLGGISQSTYDELYKAFGGERSKTNSNLWMKNSDIDYIKDQVRDYRDATREYNESIADAKLKLGTNINEYVDKDLATLQKERDALQKAIDSSKSDGEDAVDVIVNGELKKSYAIMADAQYAMQQIEQAIKSKTLEVKTEKDNKYSTKYNNAKKEWEEAKAELKKIEADKDNYSAEQYEKAKKREESASSAFKKLGGDPTGKTTKAAEKEADKRQKAERKAADELLALRRQTQQSEIDILKDGTGKKIAQINLDYQKQIDVINKQERNLREQNKIQKIDGLTDEQQTAVDAQRKAAETTRDKQIADAYKTDLAYMRDYLKEYGTFQQQKLAIAEEYNQRIADSSNDWEKRSLAKERDAALSKLDFSNLKEQIDWTAVFGDFGAMFKDVTSSVLPDLKRYVGSDEFKRLDAVEQQTLVDAMNRLEKSLGNSKGLDFKKLGVDVKSYQDAVKSAMQAQREEQLALEKLQTAQENYQKALESGTEEEKDASSIELSERKKEAAEASKAAKETSDSVKLAGKDVSDTASELSISMDNVISGLQQLSSGSLAGAYNGIITFGKECKGIIKDVAESLDSVPIVGWILSIIDVLQDGLSNLIGGLLDSIFNAVGGVIHDVLSLNLLKTVAESLRDGIKSVWDGITFGGVSRLMNSINGSNSKDVVKTIDRLTDRNERLISAISNLTDIMKSQSIAQAVSTYNQAYANQQEVNQNYLDIAKAQAGYHGSHHSWNSQWGGFNNDQMNWIRQNVRSDFNGDIFSLTPEEMKALLGNVGIVDSIRNTGEGGYGARLLERLEDYADQAGKLEEITGNLKETLTGITFDSLRDSFRNSLMDMSKDAQDFSDDFSKYLMEAVLDAKLKESVDKELEEWYDKWAEYSKDGLDESEMAELRDWYNAIVNKGIATRDEVAAITGYDSSSYSQEASKGVYEGLSQDLGMEMNGRMTAIQDGVGRIEQLDIERNELLRGMCGLEGMPITALNSEDLQLLRTYIADTCTTQEDVRRILAESYVELVSIRENTGAIIKPIKEIRSELGALREEIRQNL